MCGRRHGGPGSLALAPPDLTRFVPGRPADSARRPVRDHQRPPWRRHVVALTHEVEIATDPDERGWGAGPASIGRSRHLSKASRRRRDGTRAVRAIAGNRLGRPPHERRASPFTILQLSGGMRRAFRLTEQTKNITYDLHASARPWVAVPMPQPLQAMRAFGSSSGSALAAGAGSGTRRSEKTPIPSRRIVTT